MVAMVSVAGRERDNADQEGAEADEEPDTQVDKLQEKGLK